MRRGGEQHLALDQRFAHQTELVIFEIAQTAVNQLARARRRALREVALFDQQHAEAATHGVAGDAGAIHAAANHDHVERA